MRNLLCIVLIFIAQIVVAQTEIKLYDVVPNNKPHEYAEKSETANDGITRVSNVTNPTMLVYKPTQTQQPNGTAIIICPGGGYRILAITHEGIDVAKALNEWGITAIVLKYRLPDNKTMMNKSIAPLQDAQRAIQWVREHAKELGVSSKKVGIMGFSAGGHLASSLSTKYNQALIINPKKTSLRPDFSVLIYPVISFTDSLAHLGSRENLIGKNASIYKIKEYSNELLVDKKTPPAYLVHAKDDKGVSYLNSVAYYEALVKNKVPAQLKLFEKGGHGFGMNNTTTNEKWMEGFKAWLKQQKFL